MPIRIVRWYPIPRGCRLDILEGCESNVAANRYRVLALQQ
jgi:hypothetical protein